MRRIIKSVAPDAVETISYGMPVFKHHGRALVHFGVWKNHCALYGVRLDQYQDELAAYETSKGTIRFPLDVPLPETLVKKLVSARMAETEAAAKSKRKESGYF